MQYPIRVIPRPRVAQLRRGCNHIHFSSSFSFFLDTVQYRTAYRVPGYCCACGMIATVPGYRSGLSVLQQLTYITVPGYCERTLYVYPPHTPEQLF